tara:strand:+ start:1605 stop:1814 length:210 start_codon:yes stop_codon:yes gene_type:complete
MTKYNQKHGSPFDRGNADSYYRRAPDPHWWPQGSYKGSRVDESDMTAQEIEAYNAGYDENEKDGNYKNY